MWFEGELLEASVALSRYNELTGQGAAIAKDPGLLQWAGTDELSLHVFPVMPERPYSVEYTLQLATHYEHGAHELALPTMGLPGSPAIDQGNNIWLPTASLDLDQDGKPFELLRCYQNGRPVLLPTTLDG